MCFSSWFDELFKFDSFCFSFFGFFFVRRWLGTSCSAFDNEGVCCWLGGNSDLHMLRVLEQKEDEQRILK